MKRFAFMKKLVPALALPVALGLSSCDHKDLVYDTSLRSEVVVVYDWRNAPDADPSSMELRLHPVSNPAGVVNFIFQNKTGGPLDPPVGDYTAVSLNADLTDWALVRIHEDPDAFEVYTAEAVTMKSLGLAARSLPRAEGTEEEPMVQTPGMVWADRLDNVGIHNYPGVQTITFFPEELVCHYTVDIYDATHLEYLDAAELDATLSGMAEGVRVGHGTANDTPATMTFALSADSENKSLHGEFLTFGEPVETQRTHILTVYMTLTDGSRRYVTADVSRQVYDAPDPRHVHIVLRNLDLPKPINSTGGLVPSVDEWEAINIDMHM